MIGIKNHSSLGGRNLQYAEEEANEIVKILKDKFGYNQAKAILGSNATKEMVKHLLPKARLVHFATYATVTDKYKEGAILFAMPHEEATMSSLDINAGILRFRWKVIHFWVLCNLMQTMSLMFSRL